MNDRVLFAGPYIGEFGHELLGTGLLRAHARHFGRVIVCSRPARAPLYHDIATDFRSHDIQCLGMGSRATEATKPLTATLDALVEPGCERWPSRFVPPNCGAPKTEAQILELSRYYHRLGTARDEWKGVVAVHARNRPHQIERNWPMGRWDSLAQWILKEGIAKRIVCVGTCEQARLVEGCCDMRGSPLGTQMDIAASALCAIGPSSGWMHLASLCGCPHMTWVGGKEHTYVKRRYLDRWNPLRTRARVIDERTWQPKFATVRDELAQFMRGRA